ncbi:MAG: hypothetical protein M1828_007526 [Chrysothrix sp. TS-e1954]|nr:MAG: hypothetical protein M1828_007526 [Chrysothrix sp. TS-e1954]
MFSEYASRFLAQSQSRLSFSQADPAQTRNPLDRRQDRAAPRAPSRQYLQRQPYGNPYQSTASQTSRFPFASRLSQQAPAPLFYSATDDFREEDVGEEHDREIADMYALQRSRRDFGAGNLSDSSDEERRARTRGKRPRGGGLIRGQPDPARRMGMGIRSSWTGEEEGAVKQDKDKKAEPSRAAKASASQASSVFGGNKDRLVDVELASTIHEDDELIDHSAGEEEDDDPPSIQRFQWPPTGTFGMRDSAFNAAPYTSSRLQSPDRETVPDTVPTAPIPTPRHDSFWSALFLIDIAALFATFLLVLLHTSAPGRKSRFGDTVYTTISSSFYLLAVDTVVAICVALVWLAALRSFVRPLVVTILVAVPVIAFSFSLYPFISSYKGRWHGDSLQDRIMRFGSLIPSLFALLWTYTAYKARHSLGRAIQLLEFATRILVACPPLVAVGFATLAFVVSWTWLWMLMFTRIFLGGHAPSSGRAGAFIIDTSTWWLGVFFILSYLWTLGIVSGIQRCTSAAATSQWYFHRNAAPAPSPQRVVRASLVHACNDIFGTICLSSLLSLLVRLPLLMLPRGLASYISVCFYHFVPASVTTLTNPLTLTYAAIHSQPLSLSARGLSDLTFIASDTPTTSLTPRSFSVRPTGTGTATAPPLLAYRLSKLLLTATRITTSLAFGFGGWVATARSLALQPPTSPSSGGSPSLRGSLYAYIVGLIAGAIGWAVLGAMEGVLSGVLDAVVVCWGNDVRSQGGGEGRFCREAGVLLGEEGEGGMVVL